MRRRKQESRAGIWLPDGKSGKMLEDCRKQVARLASITFRRSAFAEWMVDPEHGAGARSRA
jgi:hypothetical protein